MFQERQARIQQELLTSALEIAPKTGWGAHMLQEVSIAAGHPPHMAKLMFIEGAAGMVLLLNKQIDEQLAKEIAKLDLASMKIRDRIHTALCLRLELANEHKQAIIRSMTFMVLPHNLSYASGIIWRTADTIWNSISDNDPNFSHYTKRATLATVQSAAMIYWSGDKSDDMTETRAFISRRLNDVMLLGRFVNRLKKCA